MRQSPLVQTLVSLNAWELQELRRWVASPAFNRREDVVHLYEWLCARLEAEKIDKTDASRRLDLDAEGLRRAMSFLFKVVKQYLAWREWTADPQAEGRYLCRALRKKGLAQVFDKEFKALQKTASNDGPQHAAFYLERYHLHFEQWEAEHRNGQANVLQIREANDAFAHFVAVTALRHGCAALDRADQAAVAELHWLPETLAAVEAGRYDSIPAVQTYYRCFRIMETGQENHFRELKALLANYPQLLPEQELRDVYLVAVNFCIKRLNTGESAYIREALALYRQGLERAVILDNGALTKATYQNILLLAMASEEWEWAFRFLEDYRPALPSAERHNTYHFNLALFYFRKKDYAAAQDILRRVDFRDVFHNLDARRMLVRIYYDTGALEALDSLLHSFRIYLQRHRNIGYHRELNANFVRMVQRLLNADPGDAAAFEKLRQSIQTETHLAERAWLLEKTAGPNPD